MDEGEGAESLIRARKGKEGREGRRWGEEGRSLAKLQFEGRGRRAKLVER